MVDGPERDRLAPEDPSRHRCTDGGLAPADRPNLDRPRVPKDTLTRDCKATVGGGTTSVTSAR